MASFSNENDRFIHISQKEHVYATHKTGMDKAISLYVQQKVLRTETNVQEPIISCSFQAESDFNSTYNRGWARKIRKRSKFTSKQKGFITAMYNEGTVNKNKLSAEQMATRMKSYQENGQYVFHPNEYLLPSQIRGLITQLTILERKKSPRQSPQQLEEDALVDDIDFIVESLLFSEDA